MSSLEFNKLPSEVKDAAMRGLRDPEDSGAPYTAEEVVSDYASGLEAKQRAYLGSIANTPLVAPTNISPRAATAPDATDHSKLGRYPNDPTYIR